jgi:hypothetical protein
VAHALYPRGDGNIIIDLHQDRLTVRNNCMSEAKAFYKHWFTKLVRTEFSDGIVVTPTSSVPLRG